PPHRRGGPPARRPAPTCRCRVVLEPLEQEKRAMKTTRRRKRQPVPEEVAPPAPTTIFSSDLLTPEEERELLADFWENKSELVRVLKRTFNRLRQHAPPQEPWPMAQFIRDHCGDEARAVVAVRRLHDRYGHLKHRLASANLPL